jgi:hypothetical protein
LKIDDDVRERADVITRLNNGPLSDSPIGENRRDQEINGTILNMDSDCEEKIKHTVK